jgi:hypothetical protein
LLLPAFRVLPKAHNRNNSNNNLLHHSNNYQHFLATTQPTSSQYTRPLQAINIFVDDFIGAAQGEEEDQYAFGAS